MSKQTKSILGHYSDPPDHENCPDGANSYCSFKRDIALGTNLHKPIEEPFAPAVQDIIKPVIDDLSFVPFLKNCEGAYTQNPNESLHGVVWGKLNKKQNHGNFAKDLGICLGTLQFNKGNTDGIGAVMDKARLPKSRYCNITFRKLDGKRLLNSVHKCSLRIRQRRKQLRYSKRKKNVAFLHSEGPTYSKEKFGEKTQPKQVATHNDSTTPKKKRAQPKCRKCGAPRKGHPRGKC